MPSQCWWLNSVIVCPLVMIFTENHSWPIPVQKISADERVLHCWCCGVRKVSLNIRTSDPMDPSPWYCQGAIRVLDVQMAGKDCKS
jgi:hypothetical protein